eukprot:518122-Prymnesium_polylepis.1
MALGGQFAGLVWPQQGALLGPGPGAGGAASVRSGRGLNPCGRYLADDGELEDDDRDEQEGERERVLVDVVIARRRRAATARRRRDERRGPARNGAQSNPRSIDSSCMGSRFNTQRAHERAVEDGEHIEHKPPVVLQDEQRRVQRDVPVQPR